MKILLLAGDRNSLDQTPTRALESLNGKYLIDTQIEALQSMSLEPMIVLNYGNCENILRHSLKLTNCELIFDPNEDSDFFSQLSAGAHATEERFFVLPLHTPVPNNEVWARIDYHFYKKAFDTGCHLFQPYCPRKGKMLSGFPLLVTRYGVQLFRSQQRFTSLEDKTITVSKVPILITEILAQFPPSQALKIGPQKRTEHEPASF